MPFNGHSSDDHSINSEIALLIGTLSVESLTALYTIGRSGSYIEAVATCAFKNASSRLTLLCWASSV